MDTFTYECRLWLKVEYSFHKPLTPPGDSTSPPHCLLKSDLSPCKMHSVPYCICGMSLDADNKYTGVSSQACSDSWLIKFTSCPGNEFLTAFTNYACNSCYYAYSHEQCLHPMIVTAVTMLTFMKNVFIRWL